MTSGKPRVPTFGDLFNNVSREERNLLEEACGADQNSARCRQAANPNFVNNAMNAPTERRTEHCEACREHEVQTVRSDSADAFKPGCEVLEGGVENSDEEKLQECMNSIKAAITTGANGSREQMLCNMYRHLRPEEQHFAGMVFTSIGEAGVLSDEGNGHVEEPRFQENLFVMNSIDNRLRQARQHKEAGRRNMNGVNFELNALDMALADMQYSMFNEGQDSHLASLFNPAKQNTHRQSMAIKAFISISNEKDKIQPKPDADNIMYYYSPGSMVNGSPSNLETLKTNGEIPSNHPAGKKLPSWLSTAKKREDFTYVPALNFNGHKPATSGPKNMFHANYRFNGTYATYGLVPNEHRRTCGI
jgi:hypothetical protein